MKLIRSVNNINKTLRGCVLTIGNFDGVHRGHQALLKGLCEEGQKYNLPIVVIIFEPQPLELFSGENAPARLTCLRDKLHYISKYNVNYVLCIRFDRNFAALTAQDFIRNLLVKRLGVQFLAVGEDFRFGADRKGDFLLLKKAALKYGFHVINTETFFEGGIRISSTAIRQEIEENKLKIAETLLGHPFSISGRVVRGDALGQTINFPTANLLLHCQIFSAKGVYAVEVMGLSNNPIPGVANIGIYPTIIGNRQQLKVHLFNTKMHLYGRHINVILRSKINNEQWSNSINELKSQIIKDKIIACKFFKISN